MKRIFITEKQEKMLRNVVKESLSHDLHRTIIDMYEDTPLKGLIPDKYQTKILNKRDEELKSVISNLFQNIDLKQLDGAECGNTLSKILINIIKKEEPIQEFLEKLCFDTVNEIFSIPEGVVNISCNLVKEIDNDSSFIHVSPKSGETEFESSDELLTIETEVEKRMLLNILIIGASIVLTKHIIKLKKEKIFKLDNTLYNTYRQLLWLNEYYLSQHIVNIDDRNHHQAGVVLVKLGNETKQTQIESKARCFSILLYETIKGVFELFISHGLPENRKYAEYIIDQADLLKYEQNAMVIGPIVWNKFMSVMSDNNADTAILPYFFQKISLLSVQELNNIVKEIILNTRLGRQKIEDILLSIQNEIDYDEFEMRMSSKRDERSILNDKEYFNDNELLEI